MEHTTTQAPALRFLLKCQRRIISVKVTLILKIKTPEGSPWKNKNLNKSYNSPKETLLLSKVSYNTRHMLCMESVQCKLDWKYFRIGVSTRRKLYFTEIQDTRLS